jgi:hypothetical protein
MNDLLNEDLVDIQFDQNKDYLPELVGDGKKFKTVNDLAKGKAEADAYIATLTKKMDADRADYLELRKQVTAQASLTDLVRQLQDKQQTPTHIEPKVESTPSYDPKEIEALISSKIEQTRLQDKMNANFQKVQTKLKEQYGNNFPAVLKEQADALGLSKEDVNALAMKSPDAFFRTMGMNDQKETYQNDLPRTRQRADFAPTNKKRTWSYYQEMKKTQPELYHNPKTTIQMHQDSAELGVAFEDGDFHSI